MAASRGGLCACAALCSSPRVQCSRRLVCGVFGVCGNPLSATVVAVSGVRDRHVPRGRRWRGPRRARGGRGAAFHPGTAGVAGPRDGGENPWTTRVSPSIPSSLLVRSIGSGNGAPPGAGWPAASDGAIVGRACPRSLPSGGNENTGRRTPPAGLPPVSRPPPSGRKYSIHEEA